MCDQNTIKERPIVTISIYVQFDHWQAGHSRTKIINKKTARARKDMIAGVRRACQIRDREISGRKFVEGARICS